MTTSEARVATTAARRYLGQLCKHFQHKLPVTLDETTGGIAFSMGRCDVAAEDGALVLRASATTAEDLAKLEDVVARHLVRFAFREDLAVAWVRGTAA
jgi:hypothetical protein